MNKTVEAEAIDYYYYNFEKLWALYSEATLQV